MKWKLCILFICVLGGIVIFCIENTLKIYPPEPVLTQKLTREYGSHRAHLLFAGDIMLDRTIRKVADVWGYDFIFSCLGDQLRGYDAVIANLEGPVTNNQSVSASTTPGEPSNTQFTFDPKALGPLKNAGITAVSLGNNHIYDFGRMGIAETESHLTSAGITFFGNPRGKNSTVIFPNSVPVILVSYNEFFGSASTTLADIRENTDKGFIVVFAHWGDEYTPATDRVKILARQFIDAGADLVIGSHPHVIQESEIYKYVPIYYSLGNFIFDQYFREDVRNGLMLSVDIEKTKKGLSLTKTKEIQTYLERDGRTCIKIE